MYLIWSNEHRAWWRPQICGYTTRLDAAGRYDRAEAISICANARDGYGAHTIPSEIPVLEADIAECAARDAERTKRSTAAHHMTNDELR